LRTYDSDTQRALEELAGHVNVDLAREIWANALAAPWDGVDRWFHGDVAGESPGSRRAAGRGH
jgi:aminoglycoside phosphotransferase (APT) family kinase protein